MSSEIAANSSAPAVAGEVPVTVDDEAYEPTYAEAFPPLPLSEADPPADPSRAVASTVSNHWANNKFAMRTSTVTQVMIYLKF